MLMYLNRYVNAETTMAELLALNEGFIESRCFDLKNLKNVNTKHQE